MTRSSPRRLVVDGRPLDADFSIEAVAGAVTVVLESRGGEGRNPDYNDALEQILALLREIDASIELAIVDSAVTRQFVQAERTLTIRHRPYPVRLRAEPDIRELRLALGAAQKTIAQRPGAKGGNRHRRLRLFLSGPALPDVERIFAEQPESSVPVAGTTARSRGQGRRSDTAMRLATETRAVDVTTDFLTEQGWEVHDVSLEKRGYDLLALRGRDERYVEVKGTTGDGAAVEVTAAEVRWATLHASATTLAIVSDIELSQEVDDWRGTGGKLRIWEPWKPAETELTATRYRWGRTPQRVC